MMTVLHITWCLKRVLQISCYAERHEEQSDSPLQRKISPDVCIRFNLLNKRSCKCLCLSYYRNTKINCAIAACFILKLYLIHLRVGTVKLVRANKIERRYFCTSDNFARIEIKKCYFLDVLFFFIILNYNFFFCFHYHYYPIPSVGNLF